MPLNNTFSLSMQKQINQKPIVFDSEINRAFTELNFKTMLNQSGIRKLKGYETVSILFMMVLLPFIKQTLTACWSLSSLERQIKARKDTWYRFLNQERFNWRKLVYLLAVKIIGHCDKVPLRQKTIIADDTIEPKSGKKMEFVSYHYDHKSKRSILGNQCLQIGYHNGINFFPLDVAFHTSNRCPNSRVRDIDKRTNGWRRRKEALGKKTDALVSMLKRAWNMGIDASFVLFDSWFAHDDLIHKIQTIGYGVICRLKRNKVKYEYQGRAYTLKQLWQEIAKKKTVFISSYQVKAVCLNVTLPKTGTVRLLFVSDGKKDWNVLLCTDTELESHVILSYYARRWAIEVFFKDAKQMLYLGKEQSNTFDAAVACYSIVMIRYLLLVYIINKRRIIGPVGPLFRKVAEDHTILLLTQKLWENVKELIIRSSQLLSYDTEPDIIFHLIDIIEDNISSTGVLFTAKL